MQVGDKKQAGILSAVAVAAIGFVVFQLVPKADARQPAARGAKPAVPAPAAPAGAPDGAPVASEPVPASGAGVPLRRDPFAVVRAAAPKPSISRTPAQASAPADGDAAVGTVLPPAAIGSLPQASPFQELPTREPSPAPGGRIPEPRAAKSAAPVTKPRAEPTAPTPARTAVTLLGVIEMPVPIAMVRVGTAERTLRVGDVVAPGLRVATITLEGITFAARPGLRLAPGEEKDL